MLIIIVCLIFAACGSKSEDTKSQPVLKDCATEHEMEFGGVYIKVSSEEFNGLGFKYGDSVDVSFSNGYSLEDIPYYNGYYVDVGQPLLIDYPGYKYVKVAINYGDDLWETAELRATREEKILLTQVEEHSTATVSLREPGKYADIQAARDIHYSDKRDDYTSDAVFANFRNVTVGNLKEGVLYRSASPCDNQHNRAPYVDRLMEQEQINGILNLSDNVEKIEKYIQMEDFDSPWFLALYNEGKVFPIALNMNYLSEDYGAKIAQGLIDLSQTDGPYLVHCTEGKDRTGFVCMLIEALAGATYQEIVDDYMLTYANYYKITEDSEPEKYKTILEKNLDAMIEAVAGDQSVDIKTADLSVCAKEYLIWAGMTQEQIDAFLERITK